MESTEFQTSGLLPALSLPKWEERGVDEVGFSGAGDAV